MSHSFRGRFFALHNARRFSPAPPRHLARLVPVFVPTKPLARRRGVLGLLSRPNGGFGDFHPRARLFVRRPFALLGLFPLRSNRLVPNVAPACPIRRGSRSKVVARPCPFASHYLRTLRETGATRATRSPKTERGGSIGSFRVDRVERVERGTLEAGARHFDRARQLESQARQIGRRPAMANAHR